MFQKCSNMEKLKPDLIIRGNLIAGKCIGGGQLYASIQDEWIDDSEAIIVEGDVRVKEFNSGDKIVAVTGSVAVKGGDDGCI